ncbi:MAG: NAD(P)/FAD-dependent oxidoreductase [Salinivirgaceae bacterium]|jgi:predicted Rossmann fold flavoprotein|nr:NAD(P)/FAD-dependent oxidoreductase [Salinivirgaceae bacterium]
MEKFNVIVIGAGAAGLIAAGRAAEKGAKVLLLEKMRKEGKKLLITGKGRCNITNSLPISDFVKEVLPDGRFLRNAFNRFYTDDIIQLLEKQGMKTILERGGRYFPKSQKAKDVLDILRQWVVEQGVEVRCDQKVDRIIRESGKVSGVQCQEKKYKAKSIIIATGGMSYPATGSTGDGYALARLLGHTIEPLRPSLVALETDSLIAGHLKELTLKNVNAMAFVDGKKAFEEFGEMTFDKKILSGPIIITLSRFLVEHIQKDHKVEIVVDLKPALDDKKLDRRLLRDLEANSNKRLKTVFATWLPALLVPVLMKRIGLDGEKECHQVSAAERKEIRKTFKNLHFPVIGHRSWEEAIVTAGGVSVKEVDPQTMESKLAKGLYFAGEVLNLDGPTGGYNLQIAWSTGWVAGDSVVE